MPITMGHRPAAPTGFHQDFSPQAFVAGQIYGPQRFASPPGQPEAFALHASTNRQPQQMATELQKQSTFQQEVAQPQLATKMLEAERVQSFVNDQKAQRLTETGRAALDRYAALLGG